MQRVMTTTLALFLFLVVFVSQASAINISTAEVQGGIATVSGSKAAKSADIIWEAGIVTQASKGGSFYFQGVVPSDCVGTLSDGVATIEVALSNCEPLQEPPGRVIKTGQTSCYDIGSIIPCAGTGQDGEIQAGVAWPKPRFSDNGDGTVTDNLTGLMWTQNAQQIQGFRNWSEALIECNGLTFANHDDWRLPNVRELQSLIDFSVIPYDGNSLPLGHPFSNVQFTNWHWSSTTDLRSSPTYDGAFYVGMFGGAVNTWHKTSSYHVWCVRGGQ